MTWFRNYYECYRCDETWEDEWSCMCDDDCPACGARHASPFDSDDLTFVIEADTNCFVVLRSPESAEEDPDYQEEIRFLTLAMAEAYVSADPRRILI